MKFIIFSIICLLLVIGGVYIMENVIDQEDSNLNKEYQGPVRPTDDEEHFRKTGQTIPKEIVNG